MIRVKRILLLNMCDYSILVAFVFIIAYASLLVGDNRENIHNQTTFIKQ